MLVAADNAKARKNAAARAAYAANPAKYAAYRKKHYDANKAIYQERGRAYYTGNAERLARRRAQCREYRKAHGRQNDLKKYGLSPFDYEQLLSAQDNKCAICKNVETTISNKTGRPRRLSIDHDHQTGKVRGLLCTKCNVLVGASLERLPILRAAICYLESTC